MKTDRENWVAEGSETTTATWVSSGGRRVCTMRPCEQDWANACLIAAAPDLLAALKALVSIADSVADTENTNVMDATIEAARRAIAKAEGKA